MVDSSRFQGELDSDFILLKLNLKIFLVFNSIRNLDSYFGRSLIPTVPQLRLFGFLAQVRNSELDDVARRLGFFLGLLDLG